MPVVGLGLKMSLYNGLTNVKPGDLCQSLEFHRMAVLQQFYGTINDLCWSEFFKNWVSCSKNVFQWHKEAIDE